MPSIRRWVDRVGFVGLSGGVLFVGFQRGLMAWSLQLQVAFVVVAVAILGAALSSLTFSAFMLASGTAFLARSLLERPRTAPPDAGSVTAVVPVHRDAEALSTGVRSLLDADYDDLRVVIVAEPDDDASIARARELAIGAGDRVEVLVNTRYPGSKAGAVNYAAEVTDGEYLAVFDADEAVHPRFVSHAVGLLEAGGDVVQGRTVPRPTGVVESLAYHESVLLSYVGRRVLYLVTDFRMAASRAVAMRRSAFRAVEGYDEAMVTEDFDFAYRCYVADLDVVEALAYPSTIEAAHDLRDWWGQRKRWMTGYVQVFGRLARDAVPPTGGRQVTSLLICSGTVAGSVLMLSLLSKFAVLLLVGAETLFLAPLLVVTGVVAAVRLHDSARGLVTRPGWRLLLVPVVFPMYSLAAIKAALEYPVSWDGEWYSVAKEGRESDAL